MVFELVGGLVAADSQAQRLQSLIAGADVSFTNLEVVASDLADPAYAGSQRGRDSAAFHSSGAFTPTLIAPAAEGATTARSDRVVSIAASGETRVSSIRMLFQIRRAARRLRHGRSTLGRAGDTPRQPGGQERTS